MSDIFEKKTLRDVLRVVCRRWHLFLLSSSLVTIGVMWSAHYWPLKYTGETYFERRLAPAGENVKGASFEGMKQTLVYRLRGRAAVSEVINQLNLTEGFPHDSEGRLTAEGNKLLQEKVAEFQQRLGVRFEVQSALVDRVCVEFTHERPDLASEVPNRLVENYTNWVYDEICKDLRISLKFLKEQRELSDAQLKAQENLKLDFEKEHAGMVPDSLEAVQVEINALESDLRSRQNQQEKAKKELARLEGLLGQTSEPKTEAERKVGEVELEYTRLQVHLRYMRQELETAVVVKNYTELHPEVKTLRASIRRLEERIAELEPKLPSGITTAVDSRDSLPKAETLQIALAAARSEVEITSDAIERLENRLAPLRDKKEKYPGNREKYMAIREKIRKEQEDVERWKKQEVEVEMALALEAAKRRTDFKRVEAAEPQFRPSSPKLSMVLGTAFLGGLGFGAAVVFLMSLLDRSIGTLEDAGRYFSVPVHGVIGEIITAGRRVRIRLKRWLLAPALALVVLCAVALSTLSITLWLKAPEKFEEWRSAPVRFIYDHASTLVGEGWQRIQP